MPGPVTIDNPPAEQQRRMLEALQSIPHVRDFLRQYPTAQIHSLSIGQLEQLSFDIRGGAERLTIVGHRNHDDTNNPATNSYTGRPLGGTTIRRGDRLHLYSYTAQRGPADSEFNYTEATAAGPWLNGQILRNANISNESHSPGPAPLAAIRRDMARPFYAAIESAFRAAYPELVQDVQPDAQAQPAGPARRPAAAPR